MVDKLNILDLELLGEMSAHNSSAMTQSRTNLEKEARADKTSSAVGSDSLTELDSQLIVVSRIYVCQCCNNANV